MACGILAASLDASPGGMVRLCLFASGPRESTVTAAQELSKTQAHPKGGKLGLRKTENSAMCTSADV